MSGEIRMVKVTIAHTVLQGRTTPVTEDYPKANDFNVVDGALWVNSFIENVAVYAPEKWLSAAFSE
jgi:hypothetical protein